MSDSKKPKWTTIGDASYRFGLPNCRSVIIPTEILQHQLPISSLLPTPRHMLNQTVSWDDCAWRPSC